MLKKKDCLKIIGIVVFTLILSGCGKYEYVCKDGAELINNSCRKISEEKDALYTEYCNDGDDELIEVKCLHKTTTETTNVKKCDNGYTLKNDVCSKTITINAKANYSCSSGTLKGSKCIRKVADLDALIYGYICPTGTTKGNLQCYYTKFPSETCRPGFTEDSGGYMCYVWATKGYYCIRGEHASTTLCLVTVSTNANVSYSCSSGYSLSGSKCSKTVTTTPRIEKGCPENYTIKDGTCTKEELLEPQKKYYCEDGYDLNDNTCIKYEYIEPIKQKVK